MAADSAKLLDGDQPQLHSHCGWPPAWMEHHRQFWDASSNRFDAHLRRIQQAQRDHPEQQ